MSGMYGYMRKLKWPLDDFEALRQTHGCWDSGAYCRLSEAERMGSSLFPPCVYTDDPNFGPGFEEGCERHGLCSFYFYETLRKFDLGEFDARFNALFSKGEHVIFDTAEGTTLRGFVYQADRRMGEERKYFESSWTYDIISKVPESSEEHKEGTWLFKHIPEWNVWHDDFADEKSVSF